VTHSTGRCRRCERPHLLDAARLDQADHDRAAAFAYKVERRDVAQRDPWRMSNLFDYVPHPHIELRKAAGPPKVAAAVARVHGPGPIGRFNAKVGLKVTLIVGTMWAAYLFTLLTLVSLPSAIKTHDKIIIVAWIAQTFLQLVLLPIIIVGQNVQAAAADARSQATYDDADAVLHTALEIQKHLEAQDAELSRLVAVVCSPNPA
jgi:hypothetical protein